MNKKPIGIKNYGSIGHLPKSRMGTGDHHIEEGQAKIATSDSKDYVHGKKREIIVQEKLDGSNVGIARVGDRIFPLTRSGYVADTSPYPQHLEFHNWVMRQQERFLSVLNDGERICGEWLYQAHSTKYNLPHEYFVAFDIMKVSERLPYDEFIGRINGKFVTPHLIHRGDAISIEEVMRKLGKFGFHGAIDEVEGAVWRVECFSKNRPRKVEFLCKYVRPNKKDGIYLDVEIINRIM